MNYYLLKFRLNIPGGKVFPNSETFFTQQNFGFLCFFPGFHNSTSGAPWSSAINPSLGKDRVTTTTAKLIFSRYFYKNQIHLKLKKVTQHYLLPAKFGLLIFFKQQLVLIEPGMWKRKLEAVLFLWKRKQKRENSTASAST